MHFELDDKEQQWLVALSEGPLTKLAADEAIPHAVRESLLHKELVRWRAAGPLEVELLEVTPHGEAAFEKLRKSH